MSKEYKELLEDLLDTEEGDVSPDSRLDAYLLALLEKMSGGGGGGGGSGLPVFTVTSEIDLSSGYTMLSEEESAELDALAELGAPITAKFNIGGGLMTGGVVLNYMSQNASEDTKFLMFSGMVTTMDGTTVVMLASEGTGEWVLIFQSMSG